jgi:hypothetical protein
MNSIMRISWYIRLLILFFSGSALSQTSGEDKLLLQISKETNDTSRIRLLIDFGFNSASSDSMASRYLKQAYDLSVKKIFRYGMAFGQYYKVLELSEKGRYDKAIDQCKQCIEAFDSMHLIGLGPLLQMGYLFKSAGRQEEQVRYYSEKAAYYRRHGPALNQAACYHSLAGYYHYLADFEHAIQYYLQSGEIAKPSDPDLAAGETQYIGTVYMEWGNLDKAEKFLRAGMEELTRLKITINDFYYYNRMSEIYLRRNDWRQAFSYAFESKNHMTVPFQNGLFQLSCAAIHLGTNSMDSARVYLEGAEKTRKELKMEIITSHGYFELDYNLYSFYRLSGDNNRAFQRIKAALNAAESSKAVSLVLKYTRELHSFLLIQRDSLQALRYLIKYNALQDSVNTLSTRARIASYEIEQQQQQKENEIEQLQVQKSEQRNYYLFAGAFFLLTGLGIFSRLRYKRKRDKEQLTSDFKKQLAQAETKALRAQMNPHFIFNSLNSINSFVMDQQHELASEYLIKFSKLIRLILDNSRSETISIEKELEALKLYILLESARFDNKFKCVYHIAADVNTNSIMIPPMLLQPFVENAIWHGLMQKVGEGTITIEIAMKNEEFLIITIEDDGIGREKAAGLKSKSATHKSHGLKVTSQRIEMMNKLNTSGAQVAILDLKDDQGLATGTRVELEIPI